MACSECLLSMIMGFDICVRVFATLAWAVTLGAFLNSGVGGRASASTLCGHLQTLFFVLTMFSKV